jgi:hypothetical protein
MSRYDLFRKRIAPIAFFLAIGLIAHDSCERNKRTHTTVELQLGDAAPRVREIAVDVFVGDDRIAWFHCTALPDAPMQPCRAELSLPEEDGRLRIDVDLGGTQREITRRFHAIEGSTMTISIGNELR